ncbi:putative DnaJ domain, Chaperone J-domain superfamily [Helianthus anomalus]
MVETSTFHFSSIEVRDMNRATKLALNNNAPFHLKAALFHSTPVLDRRRRAHWESVGRSYRSSSRRPNFNGRRQRKFYSKQEMLRNVNAFAENLFQGCYERDEFEPSSSHRNSWFRNLNGGGPRGFSGTQANSKGAQGRARKRGFQFYEDGEEVETIFRSAFGSNPGFYFWSFINDESPKSSSGYYNYNNNNRASWKWRRQFEEDDEDDDEDDDDESVISETDLRKDRIALGLSGSGPLSLEDVKNAYRTCALKWHPDRHNGSSKATAEEKFKVCSAAYQSLCDKLAPN